MNKKIQELYIERDAIIRSYYRREKKKWYIDADTKTIAASTAHATEFQNKISSLNSSIRMLEEEAKVVDWLDNGINGTATEEEYKQYMPLVSRRRHPELWSAINKVLLDGAIFTFDAQPIMLGTDMFCGCTEEQLREEHTATDADINNLRTQHTLRLQNVHRTGAECPNPKEEKIFKFQTRHTLGNWNCKGCLNGGSPITDEQSANDALQSSKAIEWCPRFIPLLRKLSLPDYLQTAQGNKVCYAGLVHSEMHFTEEQVEVASITPDELAVEPTTLITKKYVVIKKRCDSCDWYAEEKKEYQEPEQVADNQVLQVLA